MGVNGGARHTGRRTQAERSATTRAALHEAALLVARADDAAAARREVGATIDALLDALART